MDKWFEFFEIVARSIISLVVLFILTKLMGKKQISQLNFFDYIVGISIGSIAAEMASKIDGEFYFSLIAMVIYAGISILISKVTCKSIVFRRFMTGKAVVLIEEGNILQKNMKHMNFDTDDLLTECRGQGYFNLADIRFAIMETSGKISILPHSNKRPVTPTDIKLSPQPEGLCINVIMDGRIMQDNLKQTGNDEIWLRKELENQKIKNLNDIFLATCDENNTLNIYLKNAKETKDSVFE